VWSGAADAAAGGAAAESPVGTKAMLLPDIGAAFVFWKIPVANLFFCLA
jgi:hypothetical protein